MTVSQPSTNNPPRDPDQYEETDHFDDAFACEMRYLEREMVDEIILRGVDYMNQGGPGKMRRKFDYDGVYGVLVIALDHPVLVTGWTEINDLTTAMASDRWSQEQLQTVDAFEQKLHKQGQKKITIRAFED